MRFCEKHLYPHLDDAGCWKCFDEKRKASRTQPVKKAYTLPKQSPKARKQESELARIKKEMMAESPRCFSSGENSNLTLSHIIPKTCKAFATYKPNLVLECFHVHEIFEHNKPLFAHLYPKAWEEKLKRVKRMSTEHYQKLLNQVEKAY